MTYTTIPVCSRFFRSPALLGFGLNNRPKKPLRFRPVDHTTQVLKLKPTPSVSAISLRFVVRKGWLLNIWYSSVALNDQSKKKKQISCNSTPYPKAKICQNRSWGRFPIAFFSSSLRPLRFSQLESASSLLWAASTAHSKGCCPIFRHFQTVHIGLFCCKELPLSEIRAVNVYISM